MALCVCQLMEAEGERRLGWEGSFLYVRSDHYSVNCQPLKYAVFRIRIGFNADPDPAFYLDADPDPGSQINADPDLDFGQPLPSQKSWILTNLI